MISTAARALWRVSLAAALLWPGLANAADIRSQAQGLLDQLHALGHFSGAAIIGRGGTIVWEGAVGRADSDRLFAVTTVADGASLAKPVTAAAVWQLVAAGRIGIDDPVVRHVAEFPYPGVTIRHLLSHTAGLPNYDAFAPVLDSGQPVDNQALQGLMRRAAVQPVFVPGTRFDYCNICYDMLALLNERVTGQPYAQVAVAGLLGRAGANTAFLRPARLADWPGPRTLSYRSARPDAALFDVSDNEAFYGSSNIQFSARDLHAWASAWANGAVLPPAVAGQANAPARIGSAASELTLNNWYCQRTRCYFTGHHQGFFSFVFWDSASRQTAVFISNSTLPPSLHPWLFRALIALGEGRSPPPIPAVPPAEAMVDLAAVPGKYRVLGVGDVHIARDGDNAAVQVGQGPRTSAFQVGHGVLYLPAMDAYLSFGPGPVLRWSSLFRMGQGRRITAR